MNCRWIARAAGLFLFASVLFVDSRSRAFAVDTARVGLVGHIPPVAVSLTPAGRLPPTNKLHLAIGFPLRNQTNLDETIRQLYDPTHPSYRKFLSPDEFATRFGPTEADYQATIDFARRYGLVVIRRHSNRVVLEVEGSVSNIESAFQTTLNTYQHPTTARKFFAPSKEPSVPANLSVADMWGLSDYDQPTPLSHRVTPSAIDPLNYNGTGSGGAYQGRDFRNAYAAGVNLLGTGQIAAVAEFDGYYATDIAAYEAKCGYAAVPMTNILLSVSGTPGYSGQGANAIAEVSLDIELLIAMAPGLSKLAVYEGNNPYAVFNQIATDNLAKQISCSWSWSHGPSYKWARGFGTYTLDSIFIQMAAQGQSFFQASGDSDAYTGGQAVNSSTGPIPVDSIYVTSVGGTTLSMNSGGVSWSSETVWNWGNNTGSGGGISPNYSIPSWQSNVSMAANNGSTVYRNFPDVAMTADAVAVIYNNGTSSTFGGTSCAAPLWAGFTALVNQQAIASGSSPVGFLNPALYSIAAGPNYSACFHDIKTGNNIGTNTAGLYYAVSGYDLATGLGTPNGSNLVDTLAPPAAPFIVGQPVSQSVVSGNNVTFSATASGRAPLSCQWLFNGSVLSSGGNASGVTSNILTLSAVTSADVGNYSLVVTNSYGAATSIVASLTVWLPPVITVAPTAKTIQCGSNASFTVTATGTVPLKYQWSIDGFAIPAATNTSVVLSNVHLPSHTVGVLVTNAYGSASSSVLLTVEDTIAPVITLNGGNPLYLELGGTYVDPGATASDLCAGVVPVTVNGAVNMGAVGANTISYVASDGNGNTNSVLRTVIVRDSTAPAIQWSFTNLVLAANSNCAAVMPDVTGTNCILATDISGALTITQTPTNNADLPLGTNTVVITVADASGNKSYSTNQLTVTDQTPPLILSQPQSSTINLGDTGRFTVLANACTPLSFQWFFNDATLSDATNDSLVLPSVPVDAEGDYYVVVTSAGGSATSDVVRLVVNVPFSIALASSENPSGFRDELNFTASVWPTNASGTIQFLTNGTAFDLQPLVVGTAAFHLSALPRGTNSLTAIYSGDDRFAAATNSLLQIVTNHPPVVSPAIYTRVAGTSLGIAVADLATNWADVDGDSLTISSIAVSTNGVTITNTVPVLSYANSNDVDDEFVCAITDGYGGTNLQTVSIVVVPQTNSTPIISAVATSPTEGVSLVLMGGYGSTYILESTTDFLPDSWEPIATNALDIAGIWRFADLQSTNYHQRFYRLKLVK